MFIATNRSRGTDGWLSEVIKSLKAQSRLHAALDSPLGDKRDRDRPGSEVSGRPRSDGDIASGSIQLGRG